MSDVVALGNLINASVHWDEMRGAKERVLARLRLAHRAYRLIDTPEWRESITAEAKRISAETGADALVVPLELKDVAKEARLFVYLEHQERAAFAALSAAVDASPGDPTPRPFDGH